MGLITRPKKVFQHKLHSVADNILFECTVFFVVVVVVVFSGGAVSDCTKSLFLLFHAL